FAAADRCLPEQRRNRGLGCAAVTDGGVGLVLAQRIGKYSQLPSGLPPLLSNSRRTCSITASSASSAALRAASAARRAFSRSAAEVPAVATAARQESWAAMASRSAVELAWTALNTRSEPNACSRASNPAASISYLLASACIPVRSL